MAFTLKKQGGQPNAPSRRKWKRLQILEIALSQSSSAPAFGRSATTCGHRPRNRTRSKVFLFDEPLSNLDAKLRVQTRVEIKTLHPGPHPTLVYVTHDQMEAMTMADRIVVLQGWPRRADRHAAGPLRPAGKSLRCGLHRLARDELHPESSAPRNGALSVEASDGSRLPDDRGHDGQDGQEVMYSFRPEQLTLGPATAFAARILVIEPTAPAPILYCEAFGSQIRAVFGERLSFKPGETIWVQPKAEFLVLDVFDSRNRQGSTLTWLEIISSTNRKERTCRKLTVRHALSSLLTGAALMLMNRRGDHCRGYAHRLPERQRHDRDRVARVRPVHGGHEGTDRVVQEGAA